MNIYILYLLVILFGLAVGSFLNVIILRFDELKTILTVRSHCPKCKKFLKWYDLIPFFSFVILRGRCRDCRKSISWQYPIVEVLTAAIFACIYFHFGLTWQSLFLAVISSILIVIAVYDILHSEIPDILSYLAIALAIILLVYRLSSAGQLKSLESWLDYAYAIAAGVGFLGFLVIISRQKWMGTGDVLVGAFMGLLLGFPGILVGLFTAFVVGSLVGLLLVALKIKKMKDAVPFAPFLIFGTFIALFWGEKIVNWYFGIF